MEIEPIDYSDELILLVDDDEEIRSIFKELLGNIALNANHVGTAKEALRELGSNESYTFLVTDIAMPEMDGLELTKRVKNDYPDMGIIVMTGHADQYDYIEVINAGATDFINKPFPIEELEAKIRRGIIERSSQNELRRLCITDALTGLYNQRHFFAKLSQEILRAQRQKHPLALILFDFDDFKQVNDTNGHLEGDALLQQFGKIVNSQIRQGVDSSYRYGGDEFAVILIDADQDITKSIGKRIRKVFKKECNMSVSVGYGTFSEGMTPEAFLNETDKSLYRFKGNKKTLEVEVRD